MPIKLLRLLFGVDEKDQTIITFLNAEITKRYSPTWEDVEQFYRIYYPNESSVEIRKRVRRLVKDGKVEEPFITRISLQV
jgi:hypothetical protein